jgi:hypothetical protein
MKRAGTIQTHEESGASDGRTESAVTTQIMAKDLSYTFLIAAGSVLPDAA